MLCIHPAYAIHFHTRFPWRLLFASCRRARGNSAHVSIVQVFMRRLRICSFLLRGKDVLVRLAFVSACLSPSLPRRPTPSARPCHHSHILHLILPAVHVTCVRFPRPDALFPSRDHTCSRHSGIRNASLATSTAHMPDSECRGAGILYFS